LFIMTLRRIGLNNQYLYRIMSNLVGFKFIKATPDTLFVRSTIRFLQAVENNASSDSNYIIKKFANLSDEKLFVFGNETDETNVYKGNKRKMQGPSSRGSLNSKKTMYWKSEAKLQQMHALYRAASSSSSED
jgi:hypothetical protein